MPAPTLDALVSLCKRRGFIFPGSEIYGGLANSWDYGPLGVELKNNIKQLWWEYFVKKREDMVGIDPAIIMNPKVWEASGHVENFTDPLVECKNCHSRFRANELEMIVHPNPKDKENIGYEVGTDKKCPKCDAPISGNFTTAKNFNLLFRTLLGPTDDSSATVYLRGEIAQA